MPEADYTRVTAESQLAQLYGTPTPPPGFAAQLRAGLLTRAKRRSRVGIWFASLWPGVDTAGRLWLSIASVAVLIALVALSAQLLTWQGAPSQPGSLVPGETAATAIHASAATATAAPTPTLLPILSEAEPEPTLEIVTEPATADPPAQGEQAPMLKVASGTINANSGDEQVNMRTGPGALYDLVGTLENGQAVEVTGISPHGEWLRVRADGLEGWVYYAFIRVGYPLDVPCVPVGTENGGGDCSPPTLPDQDEQAVAAIRAFRQDSGLPLTFREETQNPNADLRPTLIYMDDQGGEYWVDRETLRVAQWSPAAGDPTGKTLTPDEQRAVAVGLLQQQSPRFSADQLNLSAGETTKDGSTYAYRWEDWSVPGHVLPPFAQVVVRSDGAILQYMNTLDLWVMP